MTPNLSLRLQTVLELLGPCELLADIGTDHGWIPISAVESGVAQRALAVDRLMEPLAVAERHVRARGLDERVTLVQADGFSELEGRGVDAVVIAGMGGKMVQRICSESPQVTQSLGQLVVQPNTDIPDVRGFLHDVGFHLKEERLVREGQQYFFVGHWVPGEGEDPAFDVEGFTKAELFVLGPRLLSEGSAVARDHYAFHRQRLAPLAERAPERHAASLRLFERALEFQR